MKIALASSLSLLLSSFFLAPAFATPTSLSMSTEEKTSYSNRIVFIRHAEKGFVPPPEGTEKQVKRAGKSEPSGWWPSHPPWRGPGGGRGGPGGGRGGGGRGGPGGPGGPGGGRGGPGGPGGPDGRKMPNGLNDQGRERAQYLRTLFGNESEYDFGLIFAAPRDQDVIETERTYATVAPLAKDLGLDINIACANSEPSCIVDYIEEFAKTSDEDILISWKHFYLNVIATALGATNARRTYPDERNDIIWIMQHGQIIEKRSMHCPKLDDKRVDKGDPDLEVEAPSSSWSYAAISSWFATVCWNIGQRIFGF